MEWKIYSKEGVEKGVVVKLDYNDTWMGECYILADIQTAEEIAFCIGDWLEYRGERFEINYDPETKKQAAPRTVGTAFVYEGVKFNSLADELTRCDFLDYVLNDNEIHYSCLPNFSFYAETVSDFADRIQANLDRLYTGERKWTVEISEEFEGEAGVNVEISNCNVWKAIADNIGKFGANFIIRGRTLTIGTAGIPADHLFKMGKGNGLKTLTKTAESDQAIVTRLRVYGSTRNLPYRYYHNLPAIDRAYAPVQTVVSREYINSGEVACVVKFRFLDQYVDLAKCTAGRWFTAWVGEKPYAAYWVSGENCYAIGMKPPKEYTGCSNHILRKDIADSITRDTSIGFDCYKATAPGIVVSQAMPNNMAVQNLMLPGFPESTLDPYIDSPNIDLLGIREGTVFFDGSDDDHPEIYPSIEEMTAQELLDAGVETTAEGRLDEIVSAQQIEDDGVGTVEGSEVIPDSETFTITLKDVGFDINEYWTDETPLVAFRSGMLGGREFEIIQSGSGKPKQNADGTWTLTLKRVYDEAIQLFFPYDRYNAKAGDRFVLLHIDMPEVYIKAASQRLLKAGEEYLSKNDYARYFYSPEIDEVFMRVQHDIAVNSNGEIKSLHDTLKAGDLLVFEDADLGIGGDDGGAAIYIDQLVIKEGDGAIPKYEITLREEKVVGTIDKLQNQIDSIKSGGGSGGYNAAQIKQLIELYGRDKFLSKRYADRTPYLLSSDEGFEAGRFFPGVSGAMLGVDKTSGRSFAEVDELWVRVKAYFESLTVIESETMAGKLYVTPGGSVKCAAVHDSEGNVLNPAVVAVDAQGNQLADINSSSAVAYRCFFLSEQAGEKCETKIKVGDQVISRTFNVPVGSTGQVTNHYWWRLVTAVEQSAVEDGCGNRYGYIEVSKADCDTGSDIPQEGDVLCQFGYRGTDNRQRQTAIVIDTTGTDAPSIKLFCGINSYTLTGKDLVSFGYDSVKGHAYFKSFGDGYFGARDESTFMRFDETAKQLTIKGKILTTSAVVDEDGNEKGTLSDYLGAKSVKSTQIYFLSQSKTATAPTAPTKDNIGGWSTSSPDWDADKYIWQSVRSDFTDGTTEFSTPVCVSGRDGQDGADGQTGQDGKDGKYPQFQWAVGTSDTTAPTTGWQSTPVSTTTAGEYVWQRMRMYDPSATTQEAWGTAIRLTGDKGQDGTSVYQLDLGNEVAGVACDKDGNVLTGITLPESSLTVYKGASVDTGWTFAIKTQTGCTAQITGSTLQILSITDKTASVTVKATKSGVSVTLEGSMSLYKSIPGQTGGKGDKGDTGDDGEDAVVYQLEPSVDNVSRNLDGTASVSTVTCEVYKTTGANARVKVTTLPSGYSLKYQRLPDMTGSAAYPSTGIAIDPSGKGKTASIIIELYNGTTLLDRERIPVVADGNDLLTVKDAADDAAAKAQAAQNWINQNAPELADIKTSVEAFDYIKTAVKDGATTQNGGLLLSSLIKLGTWTGIGTDTPTMTAVNSGLNGLNNAAKNAISFWAGGDMIDRFYNPDGSVRVTTPAQYAASAIRMDGSAYFAKGNIGFNADGSGWLGNKENGILFASDGSMTFGNGIKINLSNGAQGLNQTLESVVNTVTGLYELLVAVDASGNVIPFEELTTAAGRAKVKAIKSKYDFYSEKEVAAFGYGTGSGTSTGGVGINQTDLAKYLSDNGYLTKIAADGYYQPKGSYLTGITKAQVEAVLTGNITTHTHSQYLTAQDISGKVDKVTGKGLSTNDFTTALLNKLNGIAEGANNYSHPTGGANSTIAAANGKVLSSITVNTLGHVTAVGSKTLVSDDIPSLAISKITNLQTSLDAKLNASVFNDLFETTTVSGKTVIKAKFSLYSADELSALGYGGSGSSGTEQPAVGINKSELAEWLTQNGYATQSWVNGKGYVDKTSAETITGVKTFSSEIIATSSWIRARVITGETSGSTVQYKKAHSIELGYPNRDYMNFNDYGGVFNFYKTKDVYQGTSGDGTLVAKITESGITASSFIKSGGTATQSLMADGSVRTVNLLSSVTNLGWAGTSGHLATINTLAFWNGQYSSGSSNLQYCDRGRFGTMAVASASDYLPLTGGTLTGDLVQPSLNIEGTKGNIGCNISSNNYLGPSIASNGLFNLGRSDARWLTVYANAINVTSNAMVSNLNADLLDGWHAAGLTGKAIKKSGCITSSTAGLSSYWGKLATINVTENENKDITLYLHTTYGGLYGILNIGIRINSGSESYTMRLLMGNIPTDRIRLYYASSSPRVFELWANVSGQWGVLNAVVISETNRYGQETGDWVTMHNTNFSTVQNPTLPSYSSASYVSVLNNVASASKLATTRTIWGQNFNGEGNVSGNMSSVGQISFSNATAPYISGTCTIYLRQNGLTFKVGNYDGSTIMELNQSKNATLYGALTVSAGVTCDAAYTKYLFLKNPNATKGFYLESDSNGTLWIGKHENYGGTGGALTIAQDNTATFTGNVKANGEVTALTTSDQRLKTNIRPITEAVRRLRALGGYSVYDYLPEANARVSTARIGLIAQKVQGNVGSGMLNTRPDGYLSLNYLHPDYINLIGAATLENADELTKAKAEIKRLKERVAELEAR